MKKWAKDIGFALLGIPVGALAGAWLAGFIQIIKERREWARDERNAE